MAKQKRPVKLLVDLSTDPPTEEYVPLDDDEWADYQQRQKDYAARQRELAETTPPSDEELLAQLRAAHELKAKLA